MAALLFKLRGVPDEEEQEIRRLLTDNNIEYYVTSAGNWGISMPAIWIRNDPDLHKGKEILRAYQVERAAHAKQEYEEIVKAGKNKTIIGTIKEQPLRFLIYSAIILLILYLSTMPFLNFGN